MSTVAFSHSLYTEINVDDEGSIESITLYNGQNLPRATQHQVMMNAHTAWQASLGQDKLAVIDVLPIERGGNWSKFRAQQFKRSTER